MYRPSNVKLAKSSVQVFNALRNEQGQAFKDLVPQANDTIESIKNIGKIMFAQPDLLMNPFVSALINRIGLVVINTVTYQNKLSMFKRGILEYGDTIEEIFVDLCDVYDFDANADNVFKQSKPDVSAYYHRLNFEKQYEQTVNETMLQRAFQNWNAMNDLITQITQSIYNAVEYDEYITMKYMISRLALEGKIASVSVPLLDKTNVADIMTQIKKISNDMEFLKTDFTIADVYNKADKENQYLLETTDFNAIADVNLLANAFNMDKAEFIGHQVTVDSFAEQDIERLNMLFKNDSNYKPFTEDEISRLNSIKALLISEKWFMIFDNIVRMTDIYNPKALYWNYFYTTMKTFSISPFEIAVLFTSDTPSVLSLELTPNIATAMKGYTVQFLATVETTGFASQKVKWSVDSEKSYIIDGVLKIADDEDMAELKITATSDFDDSITDSATVTIV